MGAMAFRELTSVSFLERAAAVFGDHSAAVDTGRRHTYRELRERAQHLTGLLAENTH